mgnify:CR=1 FL=1
MTIKECYEAMGGDYEDVLKRLMNEARIQKFALMFKKDPSMSQLTQAMDAVTLRLHFVRHIHLKEFVQTWVLSRCLK